MQHSNSNVSICPACRARTPSRVYGKPNKDRCSQPSMFELLSRPETSPGHTMTKTAFADNRMHIQGTDCIYKSPHPYKSGEKRVCTDCCQRADNVQQTPQGSPNQMAGEDNKETRECSGSQEKRVKTTQSGKNQQRVPKKVNIRSQQPTIQVSKDITKISGISGQGTLKKAVIAKQYWKPSSDARKYIHLTSQQTASQVKKFKQETRWIPNSSFTTYFGKPPFQNYGNANSKTLSGGLMYGDYLYSHNVNPHRGSRSPTYVQSYPTALVRANSMKTLIPVPPRTLSQLPSQSGAEPSAKDNGLKIYPRCNEFGPLRIETPKLEKISKFTLRGYLCRDENQITNATDYLNNNKEADIVHHGNKQQSLIGKLIGKKIS